MGYTTSGSACLYITDVHKLADNDCLLLRQLTALLLVDIQVDRCENHVRELRTFFTVVLEPNIHTFSVLSETLPDFFKSKLC